MLKKKSIKNFVIKFIKDTTYVICTSLLTKNRSFETCACKTFKKESFEICASKRQQKNRTPLKVVQAK